MVMLEDNIWKGLDKCLVLKTKPFASYKRYNTEGNLKNEIINLLFITNNIACTISQSVYSKLLLLLTVSYTQ